MDAYTQPADGIIATASFRICQKAQATAKPHRLSTAPCLAQTEVDILNALGENSRAYFCTFHDERESCVVARPLSDLIGVWHRDKIEGGIFALHLHPRQHRLTDGELRAAQEEWQGIGAGGAVETETVGSQIVAKRGVEKDRRRSSAMVRSMGANTAIMHLSFPQKEESPLDAEIWRNVSVSLPLTALVESIPERVATEMRKLMKLDMGLFTMLQQGLKKIGFTPHLHLKDHRDGYVDFEQGKILVSTIGNLFAEPTTEATEIEVTVDVSGTTTETAPVKPADAIEAFVPEVPDMFRLGKVREAALIPKAKDVPHEMAIVGVLDAEDGLHLGAVPIFSVNKVQLGDSHGGVMIPFKESYAWADKYWGARSIEELATHVSAHRNDRLKPEMQLPTRPTYTFERYDAQKHGVGLSKWPPSGVHLTVRCVNMLPPDDAAVVFPALKHTQYALEVVDTVDSVKMMIREEMRRKSKDGRTCGCLFESGAVGRWEIVLWVLPQVDGTATLHQWLEGNIMQFMRRGSSKAKAEGRVYIEAHVVARRQDDEEEETVGDRMEVAEQDQTDGQSESLFVT